MKRSMFAIVLLSAAPAFAQSTAGTQPATTRPGTANQSMTVTGCVGGQGSDAQPYMLNNAMVVPSTAATTPGAAGASAVTPGSQPPTVAPTMPPPTSAATPPSATPPSTAGTAGTAGTTPTAGTAAASGAGTTGTAATGVGTAGTSGSAAAGTVGTATPGAVATGASAAGMTGYRLSGSDMAPWAGQRVEIVGSLVPASPSVSSGAGTSTTAPEFRVQSVRPIAGNCQPR